MPSFECVLYETTIIGVRVEARRPLWNEVDIFEGVDVPYHSGKT